MPLAGDVVTGSHVTTNIIDNEIVANSATYGATETTLYTVTPSLVTGQKYRVTAVLKVAIDVAADVSFIRIREDTLTGTQLDGANVPAVSTNANGYTVVVVSEYTAVSTGTKTFVVSGQRTGGTGTAHGVKASTSRKSYLWVDLIVT